MPPSTATNRIFWIDFLRGVALGGMLLVNLSTVLGVSSSTIPIQHGLDRIALFFILILAEGKFYPLFAFLFGWGIAVRQNHFIALEKPFLPQHLRRMAVLACFGLVHGVFVWEGDILFSYAAVGALVILSRKIPFRAVMILFGSAFFFSTLLTIPTVGEIINHPYMAVIASIDKPLRQWLGTNNHPFILTTAARYGLKILYSPGWVGNYIAMILLGYQVGFRQVFHPEKIKYNRILFSLGLFALVLNTLLAVTFTTPSIFSPAWLSFYRTLLMSAAGAATALFYFLLLYHLSRLGGKNWLELIARLGRMPLTTYICQSLLLLVLQTTFDFSPAQIWPLAGLIWTAQVLFAQAWFNHHERGPLEALWRWFSQTELSYSPLAKRGE